MIGVASDGTQAPRELADIAAAADAWGARRIWVASHLFQREPIVNSALILQQTRTLAASLMAMSPFTVHPVYATMAAAALDEWFPGRAVLCFGTGAPRDLDAVGLEVKKPLGAIRESIAIARRLLDGEVVDHRGERFQAAGRRLSSAPHSIPIMVAASGPRMLELAGAEADGVLISAGTSPAFISWALDHVRRGEARSGRTVHKAALVYTAVSENGGVARNRLRRNMAFILRGEHHAQNLVLAGTPLDQSALKLAYEAQNWARVDAMIDDAVLANHAAAGTPEDVRQAMRGYEAIGLDEIVLAGLTSGRDLELVMRT